MPNSDDEGFSIWMSFLGIEGSFHKGVSQKEIARTWLDGYKSVAMSQFQISLQLVTIKTLCSFGEAWLGNHDYLHQ